MPRPQLDHYVGQSVTEVTEGDGDPDVWSMQLQSGAVISNTDKRRSKIPAVVGMLINTVILSETDTEILFGPTEEQGTEKVVLTPDKYRISEPTWEAGPIFPQLPDEMSAEATLPEDPSERVLQEAPTPGSQDAVEEDEETPVEDAETASEATEEE